MTIIGGRFVAQGLAGENMSELAIVTALNAIIEYIQAHRGSESLTILKRYVVKNEDLLLKALEYGYTNGFLTWSEGNWYSPTAKGAPQIREEMYYDAVKVGISEMWKHDGHSENEFYIENTSRKDSKIVGPWTRPDFTLVSHRKFPWTVGYEFDVVTFEVKKPETCNVLAVFEALSHASAVTRAYVVFPVSQEKYKRDCKDQDRRVRDECSRHGVGLIFIEDELTSPRAIHAIKAQKRELDHRMCSDFLDAVLDHGGKARIAGWKG